MAEFIKPPTSTLKVKVDLDADEMLVQDDKLPSGKQCTITIRGFKRDGTLDEANVVFDKVLGDIAGTSYDSISATKSVTESIGEPAYTFAHFTMADLVPIFNGTYELSGKLFTMADLDAIFNDSRQLSGSLFSTDDIDAIFNDSRQPSGNLFSAADLNF